MSGIINTARSKSGVIDLPMYKGGEFAKGFDAVGDISYTFVGFKPSLLYFITGGQDETSRSWGVDDGTTHRCLMTQFAAHTGGVITDQSIYMHDDATTGTKGYVKTMDSTGFTLTWTAIGAVSGARNISVIYIAYR